LTPEQSVTSEGTSSAGTETLRTRHYWRTIAVVVVLILLVAELFTRLIDAHLQTPLVWNNYEVQRKVQQIETLSHHGGARVVYLGSSIVDVGLEPPVIDQQLGHDVISYNAGLEAAIPVQTAEWAETIVLPKLHPKVIVVGLLSYDFAKSSPFRYGIYGQYLGSSGVRQITGTDDTIQAVDRWLGSVSALWFHKFQLRDPAAVFHAIAGDSVPVDPSGAGVAPLGQQTQGLDQHWVGARATLNVKNWTLGTRDVDAINGLIAYAHVRHIKVVLVDMPVTKNLVGQMPHGQVSYDVFNAKVEAIGRASGSLVLNYQSFSNHAFFRDNIHLNARGAKLLSDRLGLALRAVIK
jgi:hypothetical protein